MNPMDFEYRKEYKAHMVCTLSEFIKLGWELGRRDDQLTLTTRSPNGEAHKYDVWPQIRLSTEEVDKMESLARELAKTDLKTNKQGDSIE